MNEPHPATAPRSAVPAELPTAVRRPERPPPGPGFVERVIIPPDTGGPRVRVGVLWFLLALAAATASRWWIAMLLALVAAAAAYQTVRVWKVATYELPEVDESGKTPVVPPGAGRLAGLVAALMAAAMPLAAGYGTGLAGVVMLAVAAVVGGLYFVPGQLQGSALAIGSLTPAIASVAVVLAVRTGLWAGLFLILAVSLFDAGSFLLGADAAHRWEGPIAGILGALAVTFTMATIQVAPFERAEWWIAGGVVAVLCPIGVWIVAWLMPASDSWVPALRRLDAYLVAAPGFVAVAWLMGA